MTKSESLLAYFECQLADQRKRLRNARLQPDYDTAAMWVAHYERMCAMFPTADLKEAA